MATALITGVKLAKPFWLNESKVELKETSLVVPYWGNKLYEMKNKHDNESYHFRLNGSQGVWIPLYDLECKHPIFAHVIEEGQQFRALPDYCVFRFDTNSTHLLIDQQLQSLGLSKEHLVYFS